MNKLTQQEAQDLITKAWKMVSDQNLGQYRFGQSLWNMIPLHLLEEYEIWTDTSLGSLFEGFHPDVEFFYEPDSDTALVKFYKFFVEDSIEST